MQEKEVIPTRESIEKQLEKDFRGLQSDYHNAGHSIPDELLNSFTEGGMRVYSLLIDHLEQSRETPEREAFEAGREGTFSITSMISPPNMGRVYASLKYKDFTDYQASRKATKGGGK